MRAYEEAVAFLTLVLRDFKPEIPDVTGFRAATAEADFLFGSEVRMYLDEMVSQALHLRKAHLEYRDVTQAPPPGYDHAAVVNEIAEREAWFAGQHDVAKEKFRKYLDVNFEVAMVPWKKWAVIGVSAGVAFGVSSQLILLGRNWLVSRPVPWSTHGLSVVSGEGSSTYEIRNGALRSAGFALRFALDNRSDQDITIPANVTVMKRLTNGGVLVEYSEVARPYSAAFLPAMQRTQLEMKLDVSCAQWDANGVERDRTPEVCYRDTWDDADALVLFDNVRRLQLVLPKPALKRNRPAESK